MKTKILRKLLILRKLSRTYTPFICTLMLLLNGVHFLNEDEGTFVYTSAGLTGSSVLIDVYMLLESLLACKWYKLNIACLIASHTLATFYDNLGIDFYLHLWILIALCSAGLLFYVIYRFFYATATMCLRIGKHSLISL